MNYKTAFYILLLLIISGCVASTPFKYEDLSFEEKTLYDTAFNMKMKEEDNSMSLDTRKALANYYAENYIEITRTVQQRRNVAPKLPLSFVQNAGNSITHLNSETEFPLYVGSFLRTGINIVQYDKNGDNVSVGYNFYGSLPDTFLTQYVYQRYSSNKDRKLSIDQHMTELKKTMIHEYDGAKLITEKKVNNNEYYTLHNYVLYQINYLSIA